MDKCESCGKPFVEHTGIIGTCKKLMEAQADNERLMKYVQHSDDCNLSWEARGKHVHFKEKGCTCGLEALTKGKE